PNMYFSIDHPVMAWFEPTAIIIRGPITPAFRVEVRNTIRATLPGAEPRVTPMAEYLAADYRPWRLAATMFAAFGGLAFVVAVVGIYGTISYGVAQRTHEFGVRVALGAQVADVVGSVVGRGLRTVALGVAI